MQCQFCLKCGRKIQMKVWTQDNRLLVCPCCMTIAWRYDDRPRFTEGDFFPVYQIKQLDLFGR